MALHRKLFFLLLLLLPSQLGYHFWPDWTYILGRRIDYLSPTLYVTDLLVLFTVMLWLLRGLQKNISQRRDKTLRAVRASMVRVGIRMLPLCLFAGLNIWLAQSPWVALYKWGKFAEYLLLGWYIVMTKPAVAGMVLPLSIGMFYVSGIALLQFFLQRSVGGILWALGERSFTLATPGIARFDFCGLSTIESGVFGNSCALFLRSYGTFPHPNVLGGFLAATLPLVAYRLLHTLFFSGTHHRANVLNSTVVWYILVFTLGVSALSLSFSRSAWTLGAVALGLTYVRFHAQRNGIFGIRHAMPLAVLAIGLIAIVTVFRPALQDESIVRRVELNTSAYAMLARSPLVGVGLGNFLVNLPEFSVFRRADFLQPVHNVYVLVLTEVGVLGIGLIIFYAIAVARSRAKQRTVFPIQYSLGALLVIGLVDHYPLTLQQGQLLMTLLICTAAYTVPSHLTHIRNA